MSNIDYLSIVKSKYINDHTIKWKISEGIAKCKLKVVILLFNFVLTKFPADLNFNKIKVLMWANKQWIQNSK